MISGNGMSTNLGGRNKKKGHQKTLFNIGKPELMRSVIFPNQLGNALGKQIK
jgi:hypothetical protein